MKQFKIMMEFGNQKFNISIDPAAVEIFDHESNQICKESLKLLEASFTAERVRDIIHHVFPYLYEHEVIITKQ